MRQFSYTAAMTKEYSPTGLTSRLSPKAGGHLSGHDSLLKYERLAQERPKACTQICSWTGKRFPKSAPKQEVPGQIWLHLSVHASFPMECQRCLTPVDVPLDVERSFRFVADEATAEALDEECDEDLLALSREFDLRELIEDELLMALPVVPRHEECPTSVPLASSDDDFEVANSEKPNPFAALAALRKDGKGHKFLFGL